MNDYAITLSASISMQFGPRIGLTAAEEILRLLKRLDGNDDFSIVMWEMPPGKIITEVTAREESLSPYLQCGGSAEAMVLEERSRGGRDAKQWAIGRTPIEGEGTVVVRQRDTNVAVAASEVFAAEEAANIFMAYYATGEVPDHYHKRLLAI